MLQFLSRYRSPVVGSLKETLRNFGITNPFNPSVQYTMDGLVVAIRGLRNDAAKPFDAFLMRFDNAGTLLGPVVSLGERFGSELSAPVCDPKLFIRDNRCWMTFNTGHFEQPNRIFISQVEPELGPLVEVNFPEREKIEKNWAFFEHEGTLHALYRALPPIVLRETGQDKDVIQFERVRELEPQSIASPRMQTKQPFLTIGTQPVLVDPERSRFVFIGHRRWYRKGKRLYLGTPLSLSLNEKQARVKSYNRFLAHSARAILGSKIKHNPNLFSCTYFSGMSLSGSNALVSYGINDVDFSVAEVPLSAWPD
jgi:hypothetical protein